MGEITKEDVIRYIENLTVLELAELVKELEERFGVSAAAVSVAAPVAAAAVVSLYRVNITRSKKCIIE